jgi:hypothetical protein
MVAFSSGGKEANRHTRFSPFARPHTNKVETRSARQTRERLPEQFQNRMWEKSFKLERRFFRS